MLYKFIFSAQAINGEVHAACVLTPQEEAEVLARMRQSFNGRGFMVGKKHVFLKTEQSKLVSTEPEQPSKEGQ